MTLSQKYDKMNLWLKDRFNKPDVKEMKITEDGRYLFVCQIYAGMPHQIVF